MSFFSRLGSIGRKLAEFIGLPTGDSPKQEPFTIVDKPDAPSREPAGRYERITERATQLREEQSLKRELQDIFMDPNRSMEDRKAALNEWTELTGWYRPENNDAWTSEQWKRWEEVYEPEPEQW